MAIIIIFYVSFMIYSDINQLMKNFISVNIIYLPIILFMQITAVFFRGLRQKILYDSLGVELSTKDNLKIQFASLSMIFTPGGAGEALKSYYLKNKYQYSYGKTISVFLVEKYHDLMGAIIVISVFLIYSDIFVSKIIVGSLWIPLSL
ncbi:flippase-like domain-containing protein, partial [Candidatus Woesearchaeota archaeon]|nr:flippase-like domain-containing protein [Candidatus Woesearchaeota archaeon]